jgi:predicted amidophosphoribosyltransferase
MSEPRKCECCGAPLFPWQARLCATCLQKFMNSGGCSPIPETDEEDDDDDE